MVLRWSEEAAHDLEPCSPSPNVGVLARREGTRELVLSPLPYIVVYRITGNVIHIVRILHGAQKWP